MLTPRVVAEIEKWLVSPEGKDFAKAIIARLVEIGYPETLVRIGTWPEVQPFKRFLQETFKRSQKPGELKGCLERIGGIRVDGAIGREVARIASGDDSYSRAEVSDESMRSWEDFFQTTDPNCFLCTIFVKPSTENPGNTWVELKSCCDETGRISDYSFSCKDDKVSGVENGMRALGRRNQRVPDRPFFFAGDKCPIEIVDWKELKIAGTAQDFLERNLNRTIHVDCRCCFKDILVVDGDVVYSGLQYLEQNQEIRVIDVRRYGDAKKFLTESRLTCWIYLLDFGGKGLFRLLAPKDEAKCDTASILRTLPNRIDVSPVPEPDLPAYKSGDWQWQRRIPDEEDFLKRFDEYCKRAHYMFDERDVIRFHTGVKMGLISLLAGEPGCGKSSLARLYANALSGSVQRSDVDSNLLRVFVSRNWITPYDMLGYPQRGVDEVKPDGNGLLSFLRKAAEEAKAAEGPSKNLDFDNVRCVCFEEMNLSQVEHYFSDFMQILSVGGTKDRDSLPGFGSGGASLPIGDNLVFIGTCNNDATVRQFSARFLDRCNLVNLSSREDKGGFETSFADATIEDAVAIIRGKKVSVTTLRDWAMVDQRQLDNLSRSEQNEFVEKLKPLFRSAGVPLDHRALKKMSQYVCCRPSISEIASFKDSWLAFDEAIAQMVIPKLMLVNRNAVMGAKEIAKAMKAKFTSKGLQSDSSLTAYAIDRLVDVVRVALGVED